MPSNISSTATTPQSTATQAVSSGISSSAALAAPTAAAAVGYNTQTFGPAATLGQNWYGMSFFGDNPANSGATQNGDGSVSISGTGSNTYNANISTASVGTTPSNWTGEAFGGGGYFEATLSFTGKSYGADQPAWWANDVENMASSSTTGQPVQWQGQAGGYGDWIETDIAEWDAASSGQYGFGMHNWYGVIGSGNDVSTTTIGSPATIPTGTDFSQPHKYGFLWVPATSGSQGYAKWFFDGTLIGKTAWNQYNPATPPSPADGSSAFSVMDSRHLALLLGTASTANPMTVYNVSVWQNSSANDIIHSTSTTPPPPPPPPPPATQDVLALRVSEDAWKGDAQFIVKLDGKQVGGTETASALYSGNDANVFLLTGAWGQGSHTVQIQFINDLYGGTSATDRNLHINSIAYDGVTYNGTAAAMNSNGTDSFAVGGSTQSTSGPADTLTLHLSEDAWKGDAQFTLTIDGKAISTPQAVVALHSAGAWQDLSFAGNFGAGSHKVGITFTNDAYGGTQGTDRNLYIAGIDVNGQHYGSGSTALMSNGTASFTVATVH
jgi:hypothetical protein